MDYVMIHTKPEHVTIYSNKIVAFYPNDGFIILEGYTNLRKEILPINAEMYTTYNQIECTGFYNITIKNVWRKDLQDKPLTKEEWEKMRCKCEPPDDEDCCCNIQFFPTYIFIIEFDIINKETDFIDHALIKEEEWNYCIDNRYSSSQELLATYKSLLELPEGSSFTNDHREEDLAFYLGYYNQTENPVNKHALSDERMGELKEPLDAFRAFKERQRAERELKEKEKRETILKNSNSSNGILLPNQLVGINTVGYSLRNMISTIQNDDLVSRILADING